MKKIISLAQSNLTATETTKKAPSLIIVGECRGYLDAGHEEIMINKINNCKPDVLVAGVVIPKQKR